MQKLSMLLLLLTLGGYCLQAQQDQGIAATKTPLHEVERLQLPPQNNQALLDAELNRRAPGLAPRFAEVMPVDVSPETHGNWEINGQTAVWRLRVPSPGARSLNFGFDQFFMPVGGSLIIYTPDLGIVRGPFTPADNEEHEELWTPAILGDELVIEVSLPLARQHELRLHLKTVNHDFLGFAESALSGACNIDVACSLADDLGIVDRYRDIIQSVAVISTGGSTFCTGFLVTNTGQDCTPFFMTANHCGIGPGNAASLVTYWNYNNSVCREPGSTASGSPGDGTLSDFNTGAIHRASYAPTDFTLVELDDPVSETANAWFAGWDATDNLEPDTLIGIHHPSTEEKRICFQFNGVYRGAWGAGDTPIPDGDHIIVEDWDMGTTEGGSSGSPIFDSDHRVVGQLHGGAAACGNDLYDTYGWFHLSWTGGGTPSTRLSDWLDPDNTGILVTDGTKPLLCTFLAGATPVIQALCASEDAAYVVNVTASFIGPVSLTIEDLPAGLIATFGQMTVMPGEMTTLTISGTGELSTGVYTFNLQGSDGENSSTQVLTLQITNGLPVAPILNSPANMAINQATINTLTWEAIMMADTYDVEIALDADFANIIMTETGLTTPDFTTSMLDAMLVYYWRVRAYSICGVGEWSDVFSFEVGAVFCSTQVATDLPVDVGPDMGSVATSMIDVNVSGNIASLRLLNLDIKHTYIGDLNGTLTSPEGTTINLFNTSGCSQSDILVNFEDNTEQSAQDFTATCTVEPAVAGTFEPREAFINFAGEVITGTWTLTIVDNANVDGGQIDGWELDFCTLLPTDASIISSLDNATICAGDDLTFNITIGTGFAANVNLSATGLPADASLNFETNPATPGSVLSVTIFDINETGNFDIAILADDGTTMTSVPISLTVINVPGFTTLQLPEDQAAFFGGGDADFVWDAVGDANGYVLEVARDDAFTNIVLNIELEETATMLDLLDLGLEENQYYWRVKTVNNCGESVSSFFTFIFQIVGTQEIGDVILNIHPNPTQGLLQVSLSGDLGNGELAIDAFTSSGQKVASWQLPAIAGTQLLDLSALPAGVYWLNITNGKLRATEKIVVMR